ncbi:uncharacterized protein LOC128164917 isoform X2 [Crassostrea angulata]|uniref:uncharacterized protein LOC128164917 isoform X2 n=1 Tax=Magallana angulata TaxID=2784310 RepID=UPI0022B1833B|nr:uncharacterized protein LOC128164917 isoform X2 [Crassostrea angulata]
MASQKGVNNPIEPMEDGRSRNTPGRKTGLSFSSEDEDELVAPSPVFLKFSRQRKRDGSRKGLNNDEFKSNDSTQSSAESHSKEAMFYSVRKPKIRLEDAYADINSNLTLPKVNTDNDTHSGKCQNKTRNMNRSSEASSGYIPDSNLMDKARKYSQKISSKLREEKKAIAKQYFHELLHSCDGNSNEDVECRNSHHKKTHRKKRKAEVPNDISPGCHNGRDEESHHQEEKRCKKKKSKAAQRLSLNGRNTVFEALSTEKDYACKTSSVATPNSEMLDHSSSSVGGGISEERNILRDMLSMDSVDEIHDKPQRRCRQDLCRNIPKELQWPSASESEPEEDGVDVNLTCSLQQQQSSKCSPVLRNFGNNTDQDDMDQAHDLYNNHMWMFNDTNLSEGATAIHSIQVSSASGDVKQPTHVDLRENSPDSEQESGRECRTGRNNVTVISISDDDSISGESASENTGIEEDSLDGPNRERFRMIRSRRSADRRDRGWSSVERPENDRPVLPNPNFLFPTQNPLLAARLTSPDAPGQRALTRSSVKGRPLRPNRNCRQRHEVQASPRSQRMFQTVTQMDGDEEMARRLQEEMDFEYAMTLHNAESQVQPPPCHRLSEYHTHDSDSPTTMLTRGMRQATRDMDIVLETLFHEESEDSSNENSMLGLTFGPPMLISHNANRRGHRTRGRRHDWTERLLQDELQQGRNHLPRRILSHSRTFSSNDYEDLLSIAELLGDVKPKGISSEDVTLLPEKKFHPNNKMTSCSICMSDYTLNERLKILPCFHEFHGECIEKWIVTNATCPICRVEVKV